MLSLTTDWDIGRLDPSFLNDLIRRVDVPEAEAICVSDTGIVLSPITEALEQDFGKPVFSANMASMWHASRLADVKEPIPHLGEFISNRNSMKVYRSSNRSCLVNG